MFDFKKKLTSKITRDSIGDFAARHKSDGLTLDIGCANSMYAGFFKNRIGFDIKEGKGVDVIGDAHRLPFEDGKFDNILCTEVLEHLHTPALAIAEMNRVLKKGGKLILTTRFIFPIHDAPGDYYRYTKYGLRHLFKDGWKIEELAEEANTQDVIPILFQRLAYQANFKLPFLKMFLFLAAKIARAIPDLIKEEFGDIKKERPEKNILTSGYYMICRKI